MRKWMALGAALAAAVGLFGPCSAGDEKAATAEGPRAVSVMVDAGGGTGSGVVVKNGDSSFVWTDAHVVKGAQQVRTVVDLAAGTPRVEVTYKDVEVVTEDHQDGRKVGQTRRFARILRFGLDDDIALLLVYEKNYGKASARFRADPPAAGEAIWHVGSFHGDPGINSVSDGVVAAVGRLRRDFSHDEKDRPLVYDQMTAVGHHGSSGGGVFLKRTGECLGLVTEFINSDGNGLLTHGSFAYTPTRRMREFAKRTACEWALDAAVPVPPVDDILKGRVTDTPVPVPADFPGAKKK